MTAAALPFWRTIPRFDREYRLRDLFRASSALLVRKRSAESEVASLFSAAALVYFARSGREALYLILRILGLPARSRVGVPLYCCVSVFQAIAAAGCVPVFLDIDPATYGIDEQSFLENKDRLDAVVVVHTFGYPVDVNRLRECLGERGIPIIEDCAHSLFSECAGKLSGTLGDASFFSFGMHKPAAAGGGALLLINNSEFVASARVALGQLQTQSPWEEVQHSLTCWARSVSYRRAAYGALLASPWGKHRDREWRVPTQEEISRIYESWSPYGIRSVDLSLIACRMREFQRRMPILRRNTQKLRDALGSAVATPPEPSWGVWNHFMLPVRYASTRARAAARKFLIDRGIDTAPLYQNCARNAGWFGYEGNCPQAEMVARTVCTVPNHVWLSDGELEYMGESLRESASLQ